jgi:hypothetical protein
MLQQLLLMPLLLPLLLQRQENAVQHRQQMSEPRRHLHAHSAAAVADCRCCQCALPAAHQGSQQHHLLPLLLLGLSTDYCWCLLPLQLLQPQPPLLLQQLPPLLQLPLPARLHSLLPPRQPLLP